MALRDLRILLFILCRSRSGIGDSAPDVPARTAEHHQKSQDTETRKLRRNAQNYYCETCEGQDRTDRPTKPPLGKPSRSQFPSQDRIISSQIHLDLLEAPALIVRQRHDKPSHPLSAFGYRINKLAYFHYRRAGQCSKEGLLTAVLEEWDRRTVENGLTDVSGLDYFRRLPEAMSTYQDNRGLLELFTTTAAEPSSPAHPGHEFITQRYTANLGPSQRTCKKPSMPGTSLPSPCADRNRSTATHRHDGRHRSAMAPQPRTDIRANVSAYVERAIAAWKVGDSRTRDLSPKLANNQSFQMGAQMRP